MMIISPESGTVKTAAVQIYGVDTRLYSISHSGNIRQFQKIYF